MSKTKKFKVEVTHTYEYEIEVSPEFDENQIEEFSSYMYNVDDIEEYCEYLALQLAHTNNETLDLEGFGKIKYRFEHWNEKHDSIETRGNFALNKGLHVKITDRCVDSEISEN